MIELHLLDEMQRRELFSVATAVSITLVSGCIGSDDNSESDSSSDNNSESDLNSNDSDEEEENNDNGNDITNENTDDPETASIEGPTPEEVPTADESELADNVHYDEFTGHLRQNSMWRDNRTIYDYSGYDTVTIQVGYDYEGEPMFYPSALNIDPGTTVKWEWTGNSAHLLTPLEYRTKEHEEAGVHQEFEFTERHSGMNPYSCGNHHPEMSAAILVDGLEIDE